MDQVEKELVGAILDEQAAYEMAQVGKLDIDNIEIWVWPNEGGYEPHFHFWNTDRTIDGCIKLETNEYFPHGRYRSTLNSKQRKMLVKFLNSPAKNFPGLTNWNVVIGMWNSSNSQKPVDLDAPMPDYELMNG